MWSHWLVAIMTCCPTLIFTYQIFRDNIRGTSLFVSLREDLKTENEPTFSEENKKRFCQIFMKNKQEIRKHYCSHENWTLINKKHDCNILYSTIMKPWQNMSYWYKQNLQYSDLQLHRTTSKRRQGKISLKNEDRTNGVSKRNETGTKCKKWNHTRTHTRTHTRVC